MKNLRDYNNVIFDLGGVILNLDYNQTVYEYKKHISNLDEDVFFGKEKQLPFFSDYEVGKISTSEFISEFRAYYKLDISDEEFKRCWNAMIFDFPITRINLLKELRKLGKKIFLLSNINEIHEYAVERSFGKVSDGIFFDSFDHVYYSHRIGLRKPNYEIFDLVVSSNKLLKNETLFIDDSIHHVRGAEQFGIDAIHLVKPLTLESLDIFKDIL
jgi:HAD superfamily hydrolase (TIGR01509 family)